LFGAAPAGSTLSFPPVRARDPFTEHMQTEIHQSQKHCLGQHDQQDNDSREISLSERDGNVSRQDHAWLNQPISHPGFMIPMSDVCTRVSALLG
jgi:hypothetical protein